MARAVRDLAVLEGPPGLAGQVDGGVGGVVDPRPDDLGGALLLHADGGALGGGHVAVLDPAAGMVGGADGVTLDLADGGAGDHGAGAGRDHDPRSADPLDGASLDQAAGLLDRHQAGASRVGDQAIPHRQGGPVAGEDSGPGVRVDAAVLHDEPASGEIDRRAGGVPVAEHQAAEGEEFCGGHDRAPLDRLQGDASATVLGGDAHRGDHLEALPVGAGQHVDDRSAVRLRERLADGGVAAGFAARHVEDPPAHHRASMVGRGRRAAAAPAGAAGYGASGVAGRVGSFTVVLQAWAGAGCGNRPVDTGSE